ncbi:DinB family protein [Priestia taiwanensis]|uniref:DinB family protein n=1 Tax=Priestia taiwanensis TaxID=1347902 RepID=A0A917ERL7_9BACI|nr:DinB family protein [Priestia taiwanensis]MBM7363510.1 putative damage-inducible protein DinB [Priestia taiwanensis]GGE76520.1 hypothetical protein GCM10007140_27810 [Priestia taiwanensis]
MFQTVEGFMKTWKYEASVTEKVLDTLTDESLSQEITADHWNLGQLAWHIVVAAPFILSATGLKIDWEMKSTPPSSAKAIADEYRAMSAALLTAAEKQWTDEDLTIISEFSGYTMTNALFLMTTLSHQNHHRGQMSVLMRQAGLKVPSIYGPTKEESLSR